MTISHSPIESSGLWSLLPRAVSTTLSLSALGYFIGWKETQAYYTYIGAGWAAASVPPLVLLQQSANTIFTIALGGFLSLLLLNDNHITTRKLSWICAALFALSSLCLVASQGVFIAIPSQSAYVFASVGSLMCALAAGVTVSELYANTRKVQGPLTSGHLWLIYWIVLPGLFWAPERLGHARSLRDMDVTSSPLPYVVTDFMQTANSWRLVQLFQDNALLVKFDVNENKRQFRIVEVKGIQSIVPASSIQKQK